MINLYCVCIVCEFMLSWRLQYLNFPTNVARLRIFPCSERISAYKYFRSIFDTLDYFREFFLLYRHIQVILWLKNHNINISKTVKQLTFLTNCTKAESSSRLTNLLLLRFNCKLFIHFRETTAVTLTLSRESGILSLILRSLCSELGENTFLLRNYSMF